MRAGWLVSGVALAAVVAYLGRNQLQSIIINSQDALSNPNVRAFMDMIAHFESRGDYTLLYHTPRSDKLYDPATPLAFSDFSTHPNIRVPFTDPRTGNANYSTAAGRYQIIYRTWKGLTLIPGAPQDFGPEAQDWFCVQLLKANGALASIVKGDFQTAIQLASKTWASLPYTDSKQSHVTVATALAEYTKNGGAVA